VASVLLEHPAEHVALVRIDRPEARNALNMEARRLLAEIFQGLSDNPEVRAVVITGGDKVFVAGADIKEMADKGTAEIALAGGRRLWHAIARCPKPVIAAVKGPALGGGCELAMHADIIVAGEGASFGQPEVRVGIMPGGGGTQRLVRAVGKFAAMKLLLTGEPVGAREALAMGLVSEVVADDQVLERALALANTIASLPPLAIAQIKEVVLAGADGPLETGLALERKAFEVLFDTQDQSEGMKAFIEKRKPNFTGS
jgi:enoyl-CoA hydratase/carnithine racemase